MPFISITHEQYVWIQGISCIIGVAYLILMLFHNYTTIKQFKRDKKFKYYSTLFFLLLMIITGMLFCTIEIVELILSSQHNITKCYIFISIEVISYSLFKLALYFALCSRLIESYGSADIYSNTLLTIWQIWMVISTIISDVTALWFIDLDVNVSPCHGSYEMWSIAVFGTTDFILCIVNIALFTIPLCKTAKLLSQGEYESNIKMRQRFQYLIRKTTILAFLSVLSSLILVGMISVINCAAMWLTIDIIVTTTSIILLFRQYDLTFDCCCGCLMGKYRKVNQSQSKSRFRMGFESLIMVSTTKGSLSTINHNQSESNNRTRTTVEITENETNSVQTNTLGSSVV